MDSVKAPRPSPEGCLTIGSIAVSLVKEIVIAETSDTPVASSSAAIELWPAWVLLEGTLSELVGRNTMTQAIRLFMLVETASFIVAALIHSGVLIRGYQHQEARTAAARQVIQNLLDQ